MGHAEGAVRQGSREPRLLALVGLQMAVVLAAVLVPVGFDKPSSLGLDFGHLLLLGVLYVGAWLYGLGLSIVLRRWILLVGQLMLPAALAVLAFGGALGV